MNGFDLHHFRDYDSAAHAHGGHHNQHHHHYDLGDATVLHAVGFKLFSHDAQSNTLLAITLVVAVTQLLIACSPKLTGLPLQFLVAFAEGGMLGTIFLHLLPEIEFNASTGLVLLSGFLAFVILEKVMHILGAQTHSHDHDEPSTSEKFEHEHAHAQAKDSKSASTSNKNLVEAAQKDRSSEDEAAFNISPWLNVIADSLHNVTDGISLAMAFHQGTIYGFSAFLIMCCHEIPHQFGDYALLINSGASAAATRKAQLITALGTLVGGLLGNWLGALGTYFGALITPLTAGVYLYVATVGVLPELLETNNRHSVSQKVVESLVQLVGVVSGIAMLSVLD